MQSLNYTFGESRLNAWRLCFVIDYPVAFDRRLSERGNAIVETIGKINGARFHICTIRSDGHLVVTRREETYEEAVRTLFETKLSAFGVLIHD